MLGDLDPALEPGGDPLTGTGQFVTLEGNVRGYRRLRATRSVEFPDLGRRQMLALEIILDYVVESRRAAGPGPAWCWIDRQPNVVVCPRLYSLTLKSLLGLRRPSSIVVGT